MAQPAGLRPRVGKAALDARIADATTRSYGCAGSAMKAVESRPTRRDREGGTDCNMDFGDTLPSPHIGESAQAPPPSRWGRAWKFVENAHMEPETEHHPAAATLHRLADPARASTSSNRRLRHA